MAPIDGIESLGRKPCSPTLTTWAMCFLLCALGPVRPFLNTFRAPTTSAFASNAATFVDALENRLSRAVAFVPGLTVRAGDARPSRIDGNHHTTHFQKLPFDCLAKTVEPRAQDGAVEPAFLLHIFAGVLNGALDGRRHVLHLQVLDVHAAVLLRERMRRLPVEILSNATNLSI